MAIVAALVTFAALATGAILFIAGDQELERLGLLFAFFATIIPTLVAALRSDQAASQTNGSMDARIAAAVQAALQLRRHSDSAIVTSSTADAGAETGVEAARSPSDG